MEIILFLGRFFMDKYSYDMWTITRAKGIFKYILKTGILKFSLPFGIIFSIFLTITYTKGLFHILTLQFFIQSVAEAIFMVILIGIPIGILYGLFSWWFKEAAYRKYKK
jgi:hypothetical protein